MCSRPRGESMSSPSGALERSGRSRRARSRTGSRTSPDGAARRSSSGPTASSPGCSSGSERPADRARTRAATSRCRGRGGSTALPHTRAGGCVERGSARAPDDGPAARLHRAALGRAVPPRRVRRLRAGAAARPGQRGERRGQDHPRDTRRATTPAASRSRTSSPCGCSTSARGKTPGNLVFGAGIDYLPTPTHKDGWFAGARRRSVRADSTFPPKLTIHDLRHTAASLAISAGANVKAVQRMFGHASAAMTLDTYADLFEDD